MNSRRFKEFQLFRRNEIKKRQTSSPSIGCPPTVKVLKFIKNTSKYKFLKLFYYRKIQEKFNSFFLFCSDKPGLCINLEV